MDRDLPVGDELDWHPVEPPAPRELLFFTIAALPGERPVGVASYLRVTPQCDALNARSRAAATRFGFTFEGIFRRHMVIKGRDRDTAWLAITDAEWPGIGRGFEAWLAPENFEAGGVQRRKLGDLIAEERAARP